VICRLASPKANFHHMHLPPLLLLLLLYLSSSKLMHCSTLTCCSAWESSNRACRMCIIKSKFHHMQAHASSKHMHCSALTCCSACESSNRACRMCICPSVAASWRCSPSLVCSSWKRTCSTRLSESKEKTTPFDVNSMKSQVLYRAAQAPEHHDAWSADKSHMR